jgi:hypothetical protein
MRRSTQARPMQDKESRQRKNSPPVFGSSAQRVGACAQANEGVERC